MVLHFLSTMCSTYSSLKYLSVETTGFAAVFPSPHRAVEVIVSASFSRVSRSDISPLPATIFSRISSILLVPSLQGTHLPHDSFCVKFMKNLATSTMHVSSSITTSPPDPIMAPAFLRLSKSRGRSRCSSVRHPPEGPPICTALNFLPPLMPPPISYIICLNVVPIGTSIRPVFTMFPVSANAFVPGLFSGPMVLYQSAPF